MVLATGAGSGTPRAATATPAAMPMTTGLPSTRRASSTGRGVAASSPRPRPCSVAATRKIEMARAVCSVEVSDAAKAVAGPSTETVNGMPR